MLSCTSSTSASANSTPAAMPGAELSSRPPMTSSSASSAACRSHAQSRLARSSPSSDGMTRLAGFTAQLVVAMTNSPAWLRNGTRSIWK